MNRRPLFFMIMSVSVLLDQATKYLASNYIDPFDAVELLPVLNLVNVRNTGAAFGLFSSFGNMAFVGITVVAIALISYLLVKDKEGFVPLTLILSGAAGNLIDRLFFGYVRDFIDFHAGSYHWPAFNVADSALTVGIALLLIQTIFPRKAQNTPE